jgi:hypothetical protein
MAEGQMMELRMNIEQETVSQAQERASTHASERETADLMEIAIEGEYLFPVSLFETNKSLFDIGMRNLFSVLAAGVRVEPRYGFPMEDLTPDLLDLLTGWDSR